MRAAAGGGAQQAGSSSAQTGRDRPVSGGTNALAFDPAAHPDDVALNFNCILVLFDRMGLLTPVRPCAAAQEAPRGPRESLGGGFGRGRGRASLMLLVRCRLDQQDLTISKIRKISQKITSIEDIAPQEHAQNAKAGPSSAGGMRQALAPHRHVAAPERFALDPP